jgi:hypothetical protein
MNDGKKISPQRVRGAQRRKARRGEKDNAGTEKGRRQRKEEESER